VPRQPARGEERPHAERRAVAAGSRRFDLQLEPGQAGQPHLGAQPQQPRTLDLLDAPPVQGIADLEQQAAAPDLWNDVEAAQAITSKLSYLQGDLRRVEELRRRLDDAAVLHEVLLPAWGVAEDQVGYHHSFDQALHTTSQQPGIVVAVTPPSVAEVMATSARGVRMPRKSTSFAPKPRMGLVMRDLVDG